MLRADNAKMQWDSGKKRWHEDLEGTTDEALRARAVEVARDEGYELDATRATSVDPGGM